VNEDEEDTDRGLAQHDDTSDDPTSSASDSSSSFTSSSPLYYSFITGRGRWRILMLDCYDVGILGYEDWKPKHEQQASDMMKPETSNGNATEPPKETISSNQIQSQSRASKEEQQQHKTAATNAAVRQDESQTPSDKVDAAATPSSTESSSSASAAGPSSSPPLHPKVVQAQSFLDRANPNSNKYSPLNLTGHEQCFVAFNGGVGEKQLRWIRWELDQARQQHQLVLVCSHIPIHPEAAHPCAGTWNSSDVLRLLDEYADVCIGTLAGHDHNGGHYIDPLNGLVHHTLEAILTTPDGEDCFGRIELYEDGMRLVGYGRMKGYQVRKRMERKANTQRGSSNQESTAEKADICQ